MSGSITRDEYHARLRSRGAIIPAEQTKKEWFTERAGDQWMFFADGLSPDGQGYTYDANADVLIPATRPYQKAIEAKRGMQ